MGGVSFAPIPVTRNRYIADSEGTIYGPRFGRPLKLTETAQRDAEGRSYLVFSCHFGDGTRRAVRAHRAVYEAFHGCVPDGLLVRHRNGNPSDNRLANLEVGTAEDNAADAIRHGTIVRGARIGISKLTEKEVLGIRASYAAGGVSLRELAREYGVCKSNIRSIIDRRSWAWLEDANQ
ncbi:HNH endonuclease signature motif containing protein [Streptomyces sp. NPDC058960]|uniref:HNH endonuclease signature motif containing protein n=1 Tax=Streptomyces sp. NPDC058960 TaxID=3346679 RepID=UPI0036CEA152